MKTLKQPIMQNGMKRGRRYPWNRSWSSGTLSMRLIWSYKEKARRREGRELGLLWGEGLSLRGCSLRRLRMRFGSAVTALCRTAIFLFLSLFPANPQTSFLCCFWVGGSGQNSTTISMVSNTTTRPGSINLMSKYEFYD